MLTQQQADLPIVIPEQPIVFALSLTPQEVDALRIGADAFFRVIKGSAPQRDEKLPYTPHTFLPHLDHIFFLEQKLALASEDIFKDKQEAFPLPLTEEDITKISLIKEAYRLLLRLNLAKCEPLQDPQTVYGHLSKIEFRIFTQRLQEHPSPYLSSKEDVQKRG